MDVLSDVLQRYLDASADPEPPLLQQINRETHLKVMKPRMLSGHFQGRLLSLLSKLVSPQKILEIGTYTAYATICLAEGLTRDGKIYTIEANPELEPIIRKNIAQSASAEKIILKTGQAADVIPQIDEIFDLVFIDADKKNNVLYYELVMEKVRPGGLILIDNVLWSGKVLTAENDKDTRMISELNETISADARIEKLILPVRDGIYIIRKK
ncbi:MAG: class I SAM-dependent methyltransferase [Mucilaginibacter polytrichastri]|nr:class I SAM-dependent methyltransferase [Mucilaginibacter polytrichastri]